MEGIGLKKGSVTLIPYNNQWSIHFEKEKNQILALADNIPLQIEHIGSTAIPGIIAKPVIDILIGVNSSIDIEELRAKLEKSGYEYSKTGSSDMRTLLEKEIAGNRTHHLHIVVKDNLEWRNLLAFRDYLRHHYAEAKRYEKLKKKIAELYPNNRKQYAKAKTRYVESILKKISA